jgi:hypothetical protein
MAFLHPGSYELVSSFGIPVLQDTQKLMLQHDTCMASAVGYKIDPFCDLHLYRE